MPKNDCRIITIKLTDTPVWKRLVSLAIKRGACLYEGDFANTINGLVIFREEDAYIGINKNLSEPKRSFVLAHELGHLVLHRNSCPSSEVYFSNKEIRDAIEQEADRFAEKLINLLNRRLCDE